MKDASEDLVAFLYSRQAFVRANLYEITLPGGAVTRWTDADLPLTVSGLVYGLGPNIEDSGVKSGRGVQVDTVDITFAADDSHTINGIALLDFIQRNGLDGANFKLRRVYYPAWGQAEVGSYTRFIGRFSEVTDAGETQATIILASPMELLDVNAPVDVYQASCLNVLFDAKCGLDREDYQAAGVVGASPTDVSFASNLATTAGYYDQGSVIFTSGPNLGQRRKIKTQTAGGVLTLSYPLPAIPEPGDTFDAYPGCDLKQGTCSAKFNNLLNAAGGFRGQPYIPVPESAL